MEYPVLLEKQINIMIMDAGKRSRRAEKPWE